MTQDAKAALEYIKQQHPEFTPEYAIILGSGLGPLAKQLENSQVISYENLPGFPSCSVDGHQGALHLGYINNTPIACLEGRAHFYEGTQNETIQTMIRTLHLLGCHTLIATNASGSLREEVTPGHLVFINDHINMQFNNVLTGPNDEEFGPRFIGMEDTYCTALRERFTTLADQLNIDYAEGVYIGVLGPTFETPAEIRAFRTLGADVVGMSTIPDVINARHCGMKVAVISVITNLGAGMSSQKLSHDVTLAGAEKAGNNLIQLIMAYFNDKP